MDAGQPFVDYYNVLRVRPNCDAKSLEAAYHALLKMYHPDHAGAADTAKFNGVIEAYKALRDPTKRAEYDLVYAEYNREEWAEAYPSGEAESGEKAALDDADNHAEILMFLYKKRRENAQSPGVVGFYVQDMLGCSDEEFEFHKWYLKEKGFVVITEQGTLAITVQGIDHVISVSKTTRAERLLLTQSSKLND